MPRLFREEIFGFDRTNDGPYRWSRPADLKVVSVYVSSPPFII